MDYVAGLLELTSLWLVGNKQWVGFLLNMAGCVIWVYVSIDRGVYGLLLVVIPALFINSRNIWKWIDTGGKR